MASMWRRAMLYLGLGPDEEYEEDPAYDDRVAAAPPPREQQAPQARSSMAGRPRPAGRSSVTASPPPQAEPEPSAVRTIPSPASAEPVASAAPTPRPGVRPVPASASSKPHVVSPSSFNQAQDVADKFKVSQPVILNLQGAERDLARRLIDFSSGLCYGLGGHMEKIAHQVYLLAPANVEVSADERRRLQERGLHDA